MYQATAAEFMPLPNMEIMLAAKMYRNGRFCSMLRMLQSKRSGEARQRRITYGNVAERANEAESGLLPKTNIRPAK